MKRSALLLLSCLLPVIANATTPPPLPTPLPPLRSPEPTHLGPPPLPGRLSNVPPFSEAAIRSFNLSSGVEADLIAHYNRLHKLITSTEMLAADEHGAKSKNDHHLLSPNTTSLGAVQVDSDTSPDLEPAIITNQYFLKGGHSWAWGECDRAQ